MTGSSYPKPYLPFGPSLAVCKSCHLVTNRQKIYLDTCKLTWQTKPMTTSLIFGVIKVVKLG